MEDILDLYAQPYDPRRPVVCVDEFSLELHDEKIEPIPLSPGKIKKQDYEYIRKGTCSIFVVVEPLAGKRWAVVSGKRGKAEFAEVLRRILEEWYSKDSVDTVALVMDNLNTHRTSVLYDFLEASRARENIMRVEVHYTPVHGSWLNMAEIEIGALMTQSLRRRIKSIEMLKEELAACVDLRNKEKRTITWEFTVTKARTKMAKHYPKVSGEYLPPELI
jgi:hypothetical protein